ncbi:hypothetical protein [Methylovulum sp.]|uniref:hypothetical protein n=1 Tax=Methylovulum sp. TaxID=1916980 RepID=UPI0026201EB8|nr:hypothetical protein [Methylovulum sp.]MDD5124899.1 hypothetical protein [Methylovulum sp.]
MLNEEIIKLANSENVNIDWIFSGQGAMHRHALDESTEDNVSKRHEALLTMFDALNEDQKRKYFQALKKRNV